MELMLDLAAQAWRLLAALGLLLAVFARRPAAAGAPDRRPWILFLGALALRCVLGLWGPYHHNGHGTEWVWWALFLPKDPRFYGPGYYEVLRPFALLAPRAPDLAVFAANAFASALIPVLVYAVARRLFDDRERPWLAGLLMLADPISVRYGASEAYLIPISLLATAAAACLMKALASVDRKIPSARDCALAAAGGLLAAQAARVHPAAWIPVALAFAAAGCVWKRRGFRTRGAALLCALALGVFLAAALPTILASYAQIMNPETSGGEPLPMNIFNNNRWWIGLLVVFGTGAALARTIGLANASLPLALAAAAAIVGTRDVYDMSPLFSAGYDRLFFPFLLPGIAFLAGRWPRAARSPLTLTALSAALLLVPYAPAIFQRNSEQLEYRAARSWLAELPSDCVVVVPRGPAGPNVSIPDFATKDGDYASRRPDAGRRVRTAAELSSVIQEKHACAYYLRTSLCTLKETGSTCDDIESVPGLVETARATLPARSSTHCWDYVTPSVDIVLYRLPGPETARGEIK